MFDGTQLAYDTLIVAAGARHSYFGHPEWEAFAPGLKTIEDATEIRRRLLTAFELAEREADLDRRRTLLTFVIVGGGPTGVELAGTLAEIARHTLKHEFRHIDPSDAQILLIEAGDRVLAAYPPDLSAKAQQSLERLGVVVRTKTMVDRRRGRPCAAQVRRRGGAAGDADGRLGGRRRGVAAGQSAGRRRPARRSIGRAGLSSSPTCRCPAIRRSLCSATWRTTRTKTASRCRASRRSRFSRADSWRKLITARLRGRPLPTFRYRDLGNMATIGRSAAVADFGKLHFSGFVAWMLWLFVHLMNLVSFRNRLLVLVQWGWNYFTYDRSARLITDRRRRSDDRRSTCRVCRATPQTCRSVPCMTRHTADNSLTSLIQHPGSLRGREIAATMPVYAANHLARRSFR